MGHGETCSRRALLATFTFAPDLNGVARASADWAEALLANGWTVEIATSPSFQERHELSWHGCRIHEFRLQDAEPQQEKHRNQIESYRGLISKPIWNLIIFQGYMWPLMLALPLLPHIRAHKILVSHGHAALRWFPMRRFPFGLGQWSRSALGALRMLSWSRYVDRWVFLSTQRDLDAYFDHTLAGLQQHPGARIIPNPVAKPKYNAERGAFRRNHGIAPDAVMFLSVGYYSRGKDQGFAVRAFHRAAIPGSVLVFIGTEFNEWSERFQKMDRKFSEEVKAGRIIWLERLTRSETLEALADCDIFVLSSYLETQPIAILEAMVRGKPWIARPAGCISRFEGGVCVRSVRAMARAMTLLAANPDLRRNLGNAGEKTASTEHDPNVFRRSVSNLVEELTPRPFDTLCADRDGRPRSLPI
jgi:glycosyltransferase involved in cell wall biosynthesis